MVPSDRLKPVRRVAESRERDAARILGDAQRMLSDQQAKLEQLEHFYREYQQRFEAAAREGMPAARLQEFQTFMAKLRSAIEQQHRVVADSRQERARKKDRWQQKRVRSQAIGKAMERFRATETKTRQRKEQQETDEHATRGRRRRS
jgi:flagellar FliJ protein